jgi:hypothetical protein
VTAQCILNDVSIDTIQDDAARMTPPRTQFQPAHLEATATTPARAVARLRIEAAGRLLIESRRPLKSTSRRCGFGSEETIRRSFLRVFYSAACFFLLSATSVIITAMSALTWWVGPSAACPASTTLRP